MKFVKRCALATLVAVALAIAPLSAFAQDEYTYTVRFYAGAQGDFGGYPVAEYSGLHLGDRVSFNPGSVTLGADSKYYVQGIRVSGYDNSTVDAASFEVTEDQDYVVAYGVKGDEAAYTVNYVDESGNALIDSESYYGNVGDKPVIAYAYIEGYQPLYFNLTKTLSANAADNVFTFEYTRVEAPAAPAAEPAQDQGAAGGAAAAGTGTATGVVAAAGATVAPVATVDAAAPATTTIEDDANPAAAGTNEPEQILDLDNALTSGVDEPTAQEQADSGFPVLPVVIVSVLVVAAIAAAVFLRRRQGAR